MDIIANGPPPRRHRRWRRISGTVAVSAIAAALLLHGVAGGSGGWAAHPGGTDAVVPTVRHTYAVVDDTLTAAALVRLPAVGGTRAIASTALRGASGSTPI